MYFATNSLKRLLRYYGIILLYIGVKVYLNSKNVLFFPGKGGIGVSNALGANSLAILFALGLPWLIKTLTLTVQGAEITVVYINSAGIDFVVGSLLVAASLLWLTLCIGRFKLRKSVGTVFLILYAVFITFAILVETGIILDRGMDFCWQWFSEN